MSAYIWKPRKTMLCFTSGVYGSHLSKPIHKSVESSFNHSLWGGDCILWLVPSICWWKTLQACHSDPSTDSVLRKASMNEWKVVIKCILCLCYTYNVFCVKKHEACHVACSRCVFYTYISLRDNANHNNSVTHPDRIKQQMLHVSLLCLMAVLCLKCN